MIRKIYYFFRHGPAIQKRQNELSLAEFTRTMAREFDADGFAALRARLVGDLEGDILEIGTGTGATFAYYDARAKVTATEPNAELRAAAEVAAKEAVAEIRVLAGSGEDPTFDDASFDAVCASQVLCSVALASRTLEEFKRVLRPGGRLRLLEHVRSEHWLAGPMMDLTNPFWLRVNKVGCNWNRKTEASVRDAGFEIASVEPHKIYSKAAPAVFPGRLIKGELPG